MATTAQGKRILTRDLDARMKELESKVSELVEQIARLDERATKAGEFAEQLARLDERVTKIANSLAQMPFTPTMR